MRGWLSDIKLTLVSENELLMSTNTLLERLDTGGPEAGGTEPSRPFDIKDYQATLQDASNAILQLDGLIRAVDQMGLENTLPKILTAIKK
jgi:hypothetical protein